MKCARIDCHNSIGLGAYKAITWHGRMTFCSRNCRKLHANRLTDLSAVQPQAPYLHISSFLGKHLRKVTMVLSSNRLSKAARRVTTS